MERLGKRILMVIMGLVLTLTTCNIRPVNKLIKAEHHMNKDAQSVNVEFGTLVFYFEQNPVYKVVQDQATGKLIFEFADIAADSESAALIAGLNTSKASRYSIKLERTKKPSSGLRLLMSFDPNQVGVEVKQFPTIRLEKGLIFHFQNKELLSKLKSSSHKPVLSLASTFPSLALETTKPTVVVIDCGHGGTDTGAIGCRRIKEKEITLPVGLEVARLLEAEGISTVLTRANDRTIGLAARTTLANTRHADVFVSIHANSAPSAHVRGIETFCIDSQDFSSKFATLDTAQKKVADGFFLLRCQLGQRLADSLHAHVIAQVSQNKYPYVDRKVKHGASQVLLGAHMPAVLCEIGFLSNESESRLLTQQKYQRAVAQGISNGILAYLEEQNA